MENALKLKRIAKEKGNKAIDVAWKSKLLYGQYALRSQKVDVDLHDTRQWLGSAGLKTETEWFIVTVQDQRNGADPRFFCTSTETIGHLISGCTVLVPNEYTNRHNRVGQNIHWKICNHYNTETPDQWYEHELLPVVDTPKVTILWDFLIRTERIIQANRPDIVIKHKQSKTCQLIDMSVPSYSNIFAKEFEKLSKYKRLEIEIAKMWKMKQKPYQLLQGHLA